MEEPKVNSKGKTMDGYLKKGVKLF